MDSFNELADKKGLLSTKELGTLLRFFMMMMMIMAMMMIMMIMTILSLNDHDDHDNDNDMAVILKSLAQISGGEPNH